MIFRKLLRIFVYINYKNEDMKKLILTLAFLGMTLVSYPLSKNNFDVRHKDSGKVRKIMEVLKMVESRNDHKAVSPNKAYYGVLQIGKVCIREVNRLYGTNYTHRDAFSVSKSEEIFIKIITAGIDRFRVRYKREPTEEDIVRMWNGGIYTGYKTSFTKKYYLKYLKFKSKYF